MKNNLEIHEFKEDNPYGLYIVGVDKYRIPNSTCIRDLKICISDPDEIDKIVATYHGTPNKY